MQLCGFFIKALSDICIYIKDFFNAVYTMYTHSYNVHKNIQFLCRFNAIIDNIPLKAL
jgi:hypothetical protein